MARSAGLFGATGRRPATHRPRWTAASRALILPAHACLSAQAVARAAEHWAVAALCRDPEVERQALSVEDAEAVADLLVLPVHRRAEPDARRPHEPLPDREAVADVPVQTVPCWKSPWAMVAASRTWMAGRHREPGARA